MKVMEYKNEPPGWSDHPGGSYLQFQALNPKQAPCHQAGDQHPRPENR